VGWQYEGDKAYYYRSRRQGGRVVTEYVGTGETARRAAAEDQQRRLQRRDKRRAQQAEFDKLAELHEAVARVYKQTALLQKASLVFAGYYYHWARVWRRRKQK